VADTLSQKINGTAVYAAAPFPRIEMSALGGPGDRLRRYSGAVMRRRISATARVTAAIVMMIGAAIMMAAAVSFAGTPTLGEDCGTGAAIAGSDSAGKVTLGAGVSSCTIEFSAPGDVAPACSATNETNSGGNPMAVGTKSTTSSVVLISMTPWRAGDVVSYICEGY
jgi:hypothetical protein